jgi:hypothetical protein
VQYLKGIGDGGRSGTSPGSVKAVYGSELTYQVGGVFGCEGRKAISGVVKNGVVVG